MIQALPSLSPVPEVCCLADGSSTGSFGVMHSNIIPKTKPKSPGSALVSAQHIPTGACSWIGWDLCERDWVHVPLKFASKKPLVFCLQLKKWNTNCLNFLVCFSTKNWFPVREIKPRIPIKLSSHIDQFSADIAYVFRLAALKIVELLIT